MPSPQKESLKKEENKNDSSVVENKDKTKVKEEVKEQKTPTLQRTKTCLT